MIGALPFSDTGNTCGLVDDYFALFCGGIGSPDSVYEYTPVSNITVDISLCGSSYDTLLHVYENDCSWIEMVCNDDYCVLGSQLDGVSLTSGNTYYIVVDGASGGCGDYTIYVTSEDIVCSVNCPPDAYVEGEACGGNTNGGCNMGTPAFEPIACGDTVCGTVWANGGIRDTDWYEVVTAGDTQLTWTVEAELPIVIGLVAFNNPGSG